MSGRHIEKRLANDGVVPNFELVTILEDERRRLKWFRRVGRGGVINAIRRMGSGHVLHRRDIRVRSGSTAIKNRGPALVVGVLLVRFGASVVLRFADVNGVRHRNRVVRWWSVRHEVVMMPAVAIAAMAINRNPGRGAYSRTGRVSAGSEGRNAGARAIDGVTAESR